jgi:hypothetical protein
MARRSTAFRLVRGLMAALAASYLALVTAIWYWQATFIFQPSPVVGVTPGDLGVPFAKVSLPIGGGQLAGWWVPSDDTRAATLLYLHGNASNVGANAQEVVRSAAPASMSSSLTIADMVRAPVDLPARNWCTRTLSGPGCIWWRSDTSRPRRS